MVEVYIQKAVPFCSGDSPKAATTVVFQYFCGLSNETVQEVSVEKSILRFPQWFDPVFLTRSRWGKFLS